MAVEYKEASWTGIICGIITSEQLDCISIRGSLTGLLRNGSRNLEGFIISPMNKEGLYNQNPLIIVKSSRGYSFNLGDYSVGKKLVVSGSFSYQKQKDRNVIGTIDASGVEFLEEGI